MSTLKGVWDYRETSLYPKLFGQGTGQLFPLAAEDFTERFQQDSFDPRWLHLGVLVYPPTSSRASWLYVTSGCSTPWDREPADYQAEEPSWLGMEFVMETAQRADWPIALLKHLMASQVLVCHGRYGDIPGLDYGDRVPIGGPIDPDSDSPLRFVLICEPTHYPASGQLASGRFDFLHVVGISEAERDFARERGNEELLQRLADAGAFPLTDPARPALSLAE